MDLGFQQAGFQCVRSIDCDATALSNLSENLGSETCQLDLGNFRDEDINLLDGCDVIVAGPPCQGFSTAGLNNPNDERNDHVSNVARIAGLCKPKIVVIENVRGLLNPKNSMHFDKTIALLKQYGYSVSWEIHNLADYGMPQRRVRVLIVAILSATPLDIHIVCRERTNLRAALKEVEKVNDFAKPKLDPKSNEMCIAEKIAPGQKLSNVRSGLSSVHTWEIPEVFGRVTKAESTLLETMVKLRRQNRRRDYGDADPVLEEDVRQFFGEDTLSLVDNLILKKYLRRVGSYIDLTNTFNGKYRRLKWDDVSPTVDTRFGQPRYFLHPSEHRGFSFREAARIQGFPDNYHFRGSETAKFRMIGNAVPPTFARLVAEDILAKWSSL